MEFDWEKFKRGGLAVHCATKEACDEFMKLCEINGFIWASGNRATKFRMYERFGSETAINFYLGTLYFGSKGGFEKEGFEIYEYNPQQTETKPTAESPVNYRDNIISIIDRQREKGISKYGETLEDNVTLSTEQRIEHLEEELVDGLEYCEHLKRTLCDSLSANDYQRMAMRTAGDKSENYLDNAIMGLCGEVGECADIVKKHHFQGHDLDREKLKDELSDVCWYVALLATALDLTLEEVMLHNIEKLKKRYPDGFDKSRSINRDKVTN